jgi:CubicO group peptidase (beta-lactamase class C family)
LAQPLSCVRPNTTAQVHRFLFALAVIAAVVVAQPRPVAQGLSFSLFERYLESLREQAGIPGMSALVLVNGSEAWSAGFGRADIENGLRPTADTPYLIGELSQALGATLLLKECVDESYAELNDPVRDWFPGFAEPGTTIAQLLGHVAGDGSFRYDPARFASLTAVIEACSENPYPRLLNEEIFTRLALAFSAPGTAVRSPAPSDFDHFDAADLARFAEVVNRMARPYQVDRGRHVRTDLAAVRVDAATGIVSTVRDLARFDAALRDDLLERATLERAWRPLGPGLPSGLGWFVQAYNRERVVWQFGQVRNAYSALMVKVPNRGLTFILLANSDALAAPFGGSVWDVTASAFARTFLLMYVP